MVGSPRKPTRQGLLGRWPPRRARWAAAVLLASDRKRREYTRSARTEQRCRSMTSIACSFSDRADCRLPGRAPEGGELSSHGAAVTSRERLTDVATGERGVSVGFFHERHVVKDGTADLGGRRHPEPLLAGSARVRQTPRLEVHVAPIAPLEPSSAIHESLVFRRERGRLRTAWSARTIFLPLSGGTGRRCGSGLRRRRFGGGNCWRRSRSRRDREQGRTERGDLQTQQGPAGRWRLCVASLGLRASLSRAIA